MTRTLCLAIAVDNSTLTQDSTLTAICMVVIELKKQEQVNTGRLEAVYALLPRFLSSRLKKDGPERLLRCKRFCLNKINDSNESIVTLKGKFFLQIDDSVGEQSRIEVVESTTWCDVCADELFVDTPSGAEAGSLRTRVSYDSIGATSLSPSHKAIKIRLRSVPDDIAYMLDHPVAPAALAVCFEIDDGGDVSRLELAFARVSRGAEASESPLAPKYSVVSSKALLVAREAQQPPLDFGDEVQRNAPRAVPPDGEKDSPSYLATQDFLPRSDEGGSALPSRISSAAAEEEPRTTRQAAAKPPSPAAERPQQRQQQEELADSDGSPAARAPALRREVRPRGLPAAVPGEAGTRGLGRAREGDTRAPGSSEVSPERQAAAPARSYSAKKKPPPRKMFSRTATAVVPQLQRGIKAAAFDDYDFDAYDFNDDLQPPEVVLAAKKATAAPAPRPLTGGFPAPPAVAKAKMRRGGAPPPATKEQVLRSSARAPPPFDDSKEVGLRVVASPERRAASAPRGGDHGEEEPRGARSAPLEAAAATRPAPRARPAPAKPSKPTSKPASTKEPEAAPPAPVRRPALLVAPPPGSPSSVDEDDLSTGGYALPTDMSTVRTSKETSPDSPLGEESESDYSPSPLRSRAMLIDEEDEDDSDEGAALWATIMEQLKERQRAKAARRTRKLMAAATGTALGQVSAFLSEWVALSTSTSTGHDDELSGPPARSDEDALKKATARALRDMESELLVLQAQQEQLDRACADALADASRLCRESGAAAGMVRDEASELKSHLLLRKRKHTEDFAVRLEAIREKRPFVGRDKLAAIQQLLLQR